MRRHTSSSQPMVHDGLRHRLTREPNLWATTFGNVLIGVICLGIGMAIGMSM